MSSAPAFIDSKLHDIIVASYFNLFYRVFLKETLDLTTCRLKAYQEKRSSNCHYRLNRQHYDLQPVSLRLETEPTFRLIRDHQTHWLHIPKANRLQQLNTIILIALKVILKLPSETLKSSIIS